MGNCVHSQIHLVNQLTCSLNEPSERKTSKILNLQLQEVQVPKQIQNLLVSGIAENQGIRKKIFTNLSISGVFNLLIKSLISLSSVLLMPRERAPRSAGALPNPPCSLAPRNISPDQEGISVLTESRATLLVLSPTEEN